MFLVSGLATVLFLGGWDDGLGILSSIKAASPTGVGSFLANAIGFLFFLVKASMLVCVQIWVRWTLPRLRIDQVMTTCLKYLIPISCFLFAGTVTYPLVLATMSGKTSIIGQPAGERLVQPKKAAGVSSAGATTESHLRITATGPEGSSR